MTIAPQSTGLISGETVVGVGKAVAGFVPGGQAINVALSIPEGAYKTARQRREMSEQLGIQDITKERHSLSAKRFVDKTSWNWLKLTATAIGGLAGSASAMALLSFIVTPFIGVPLGLIAGGIAGSMLVGAVYDKIFSVPNEDSIMLVQQLHVLQQSGQPVAPEMVFAALAGNLKGAEGKRLEKELQKKIGTSDFNQAFQGGRLDALHNMMVANDAAIRADTGMLVDPNNPSKTASEQLTDWVNSGQLDVRRLAIQRNLPIQSLEQTMQAQNFMPVASSVEVPMLPPVMRPVKGHTL